MSLKGLWNRITNIGIDETALGKEVVKARLLNQLIVASLFTSLLALITYIVFFEGYTIIFTTTANIILESIGLFLAFRQKHIAVRYIAAFAFPTLIAVHVFILGGNFGEANIFLAMGFSSFILFEGQRRWQITAVLYISALFIVTKLYVINYQIGSDVKINPYDEIVTFPMMLIILGLIILIYQSELKKYEAQKSKFIKDLKSKNLELEEFTYIASHDLKTPLRTVSSYLDLSKIHLQKKNLAEATKSLDAAKKGTVQMYALINDILEYKRITQDEDSVEETIDLNALIETVREKIGPAFQQKKILIQYESLPTIRANQNEILALFQNLIENGLKYNESAQAKISITHQVTDQHLKIAFEDNGIGIEEAHYEKIFKFFNRLHRPEDYEGSGIGLGLCKKIVQKYEGDISVQSKIGDGTTFTIYFPKTLLLK
jgi:signal transduction histidine kinase